MTAINPTAPRPATAPATTNPPATAPAAASTTQGSATPAAVPSTQDTLSTAAAQGAEAQTLQDFAQAQQAQQVQDVNGVDFSKMSQDQQYDYLQKLTVQQAAGDESAWKTGDREVNLIGVRSMQDGKAGSAEADTYNDTIYACRIVDGKKEVQAFKASVDAGVQDNPEGKGIGYYDRKGDYQGVTHLADGFYRDAFKRGEVAGDDFGLRQQGLVRLQADRNNDGIVQDDEKLNGGKGVLAGARQQLQFHSGGEGDKIGASSAGCQVIHPSDWARFQDVLADAPRAQDSVATGGGFSYLLTDASKLPPPDSEFTALRRQDVDQRTVFQTNPALGEQSGNKDYTKGIIEENHFGSFTFGSIDGHDKNRKFEIERPSSSGDHNSSMSSWLRNILPKWFDTSFGSGIGIVRTPTTSLTSDRIVRFDFWLRS